MQSNFKLGAILSFIILIWFGPSFTFLFPASRSEEGELLNAPFSRSCSLCENHHYTIKAGNTIATRTLVKLDKTQDPFSN